MAQGIDQWTAGEHALCTIARWMIDGGDTAKTREFIRWLAPSDVVQTEHLFILAALKDLESESEELSFDALQAALFQQYPGGFIKVVLGGIVENRHAWPRNDAEFDELLRILKKFRATREKELMQAKRNAVYFARLVLDRKMRVINGARLLAWADGQFWDDELAIFPKLVDAARDYPEGPIRRHWAADALARKDRELIQLESDARPEIETACRTLIDRWGAD